MGPSSCQRIQEVHECIVVCSHCSLGMHGKHLEIRITLPPIRFCTAADASLPVSFSPNLCPRPQVRIPKLRAVHARGTYVLSCACRRIAPLDVLSVIPPPFPLRKHRFVWAHVRWAENRCEILPLIGSAQDDGGSKCAPNASR